MLLEKLTDLYSAGGWSVIAQGWRFDREFLSSTCQSVLGQDTAPQTAPNSHLSILSCVSVSEYEANCKAFWIKALDKSNHLPLTRPVYLKSLWGTMRSDKLKCLLRTDKCISTYLFSGMKPTFSEFILSLAIWLGTA